MGLREEAYLRYLAGQGGRLTESNVSNDMFAALQQLAEKASGRGGQLLYSDYNPNDAGEGQLKATIGRTAPGNITREGNYWRIRDTYDFNPVEGGVWGDLKMAGEAALHGDATTVLGRLTHASPFGKAYDVDVRVPMTAKQIEQYNPKATKAQRAVFNDGMVFGGKKYNWELRDINPTESYDDIAKRQFAGSAYKAEGTNLDKMRNMLAYRNKGYGNASGSMWVPVEVGNASTNAPPTSSSSHTTPALFQTDGRMLGTGERFNTPPVSQTAKDNLNKHLETAKTINKPTLATGISQPVQHNIVDGIAKGAQAAVETVGKYLSHFKLPW